MYNCKFRDREVMIHHSLNNTPVKPCTAPVCVYHSNGEGIGAEAELYTATWPHFEAK